MTELKEYVDRIRDDIKALYEADYTDEQREEMEENGEAYDLYSYFTDVLDIEYRIGGDGQYRSVEVAVTLGGPNVYIDTGRGEVSGYWGSKHETAWIPNEICEEIDAIFEELYLCSRG